MYNSVDNLHKRDYNLHMEEKNLGMTIVCSSCKHIILSGGKFLGLAWFKIQCPNQDCATFKDRSKQSIVVGKKYFVTVSVIIVSILFFHLYQTIQAKKNITCASFSSQEQAQTLFETDPIKYHILDKNNNGIVCETYKYKN